MNKSKSAKFDWYKFKQRFSLRKSHFGAVSVILGTALFLVSSTNTVAAEEVITSSSVSVNTGVATAVHEMDTTSTASESVPVTGSVASTPTVTTSSPYVETPTTSVSETVDQQEAAKEPSITTDAPTSQSSVRPETTNTVSSESVASIVNSAEALQTGTAPEAASSSSAVTASTATFRNTGTAAFTPVNGAYAVEAPGVKDPEQAAKLKNALFFPDWSKATNLGPNSRGHKTLQVGTELVVSPFPGYEITITVTNLQPFNSTEEYKQRLLAAGVAETDLANYGYDPNAQNQAFTQVGQDMSTRQLLSNGQNSSLEIRTQGTTYANLRNHSGYEIPGIMSRFLASRSNGGITFRLKGTFNGKEIPVQAFIADGESLDRPEVMIVKTNGEPFELIDLSTTGVSLQTDATVTPPIINTSSYFYTNNDKQVPQIFGYNMPELLLNPNPNGGQNTTLISDINTGTMNSDALTGYPHAVPILSTDHVTELSTYYVLSGEQALILGFVVPMDKGDAPTSYGTAAHFIHTTAAETDYKLGDQTGSETASITPKPVGNNPYLGTVKADYDDMITPQTNRWGADDATATFQGYSYDEGESQLTGGTYNSFKKGASSYSLDLIANRDGFDKAYIGAWVDFNNNGIFDESEKASAEVTADGIVSLDFKLSQADVPADVTKLGARVRISSIADDVANATGAARDGEVEDFQINVITADYTLSATSVATSDIQGKTQEGRPEFKTNEPDITEFASYNLIDPASGTIIVGNSLPATYNGKQVGTYTIDPQTGTVIFVPNKDFVGTPDAAIVQASVPDGKTIRATYTPTVTTVQPTAESATSSGLQGQTQTGTPVFTAGDPAVPIDDTVPATFEDGTTTKQVPGEGTYTVAPDGTVTFTPEKTFTGTAQGVSVVRQDSNGTKVSSTYTPTVTAVQPTAESATSSGLQGQTQTGTPVFTAGDPAVPIDDTVPATFEDGTTTKQVPGEGTYTVAPDGTVTFTPEKTFTGTAQGMSVVRQDSNGTIINAIYIPTVTPSVVSADPAVSQNVQGQVQSGKPNFYSTVALDDTVPATFEDGTTTKQIPGEGTYTVAPDGTVTFVPESGFIGTGRGVVVIRQDITGQVISAAYQPTVTPLSTLEYTSASAVLPMSSQEVAPTSAVLESDLVSNDILGTHLPQTGEKNNFLLPMAGIMLASLGTASLHKRKED